MAEITILHAADLHVDSPLRGLPEYDGAPVEAVRRATRNTFVRLVDEAVDRKVDLLLLAGDLYDGTWKDYNTGLFVVKEFARLHEEGIPVVVVHGNHDAESK
ncbi:MAG: DNA repair exonuclease, partial [Acidimicrobiales bacterium]